MQEISDYTQRLCWIVLTRCSGLVGHHPSSYSTEALILTSALPGETEAMIRQKLLDSIAEIDREWLRRMESPMVSRDSHRQTFCQVSVRFSDYDGNRGIICSAIEVDDDNAPGSSVVHLTVRVEVKHFLPRNSITGEFNDLHQQVKCLEALRVCFAPT